MPRPTLSLVLPIYNEEEVIPELHLRLQDFLAKLKVRGTSAMHPASPAAPPRQRCSCLRDGALAGSARHETLARVFCAGTSGTWRPHPTATTTGGAS